MSRKWMILSAVAGCCLAGGVAYAVSPQEYVDPTGLKSWGALVFGYVDGSGKAQAVSATTPLPVGATAVSLTFVPLRISTVTTGGTAVAALNAGDRTKGGFLLNPENATINLCINEQTAASGTVSAGALVCIAPSQAYTLTPSTLGVSVVSSDSAHPFAGQGYN